LLLIIILVAHSVIEMIPLASLTGIMFVVVIKTFSWRSFKVIFQSIKYYRKTGSAPLLDSVTIVIVTVVTVLTDLAIAVGCGLVFACLVFVWKNGQRITAESHVREDGVKVYVIKGG
jgi:SulP family sulfate permease